MLPMRIKLPPEVLNSDTQNWVTVRKDANREIPMDQDSFAIPTLARGAPKRLPTFLEHAPREFFPGRKWDFMFLD